MGRERRLKVRDDYQRKVIITGKNAEKSGGVSFSWDTSDTVQQYVAPSYVDQAELQMLSFEDLTDRIEGSDLPQPQKDRVLSSLLNLRSELDGAENVNLKATRTLLEEIRATMPDLREPLWHWLTETVQVPSPVEIVARNLLQA
jgi:hypothetical protein